MSEKEYDNLIQSEIIRASDELIIVPKELK